MPRSVKKQPFDMKWKRLAQEAREEAQKVPPGRARDALLKKALQLETACHLNDWISSPGLRPPINSTPHKE